MLNWLRNLFDVVQTSWCQQKRKKEKNSCFKTHEPLSLKVCFVLAGNVSLLINNK